MKKIALILVTSLLLYSCSKEPNGRRVSPLTPVINSWNLVQKFKANQSVSFDSSTWSISQSSTCIRFNYEVDSLRCNNSTIDATYLVITNIDGIDSLIIKDVTMNTLSLQVVKVDEDTITYNFVSVQ